MLNDFKNKKRKHQILEVSTSFLTCINEFLFCVPFSLKEIALKVIEENNPKYGLLLYTPLLYNNLENRISIFKRAKTLNDGYSNTLKQAIIKRMGSEVCQYHSELAIKKLPDKPYEEGQLVFEGFCEK